MSQAGYWEQKLKELSTWQADVRLEQIKAAGTGDGGGDLSA